MCIIISKKDLHNLDLFLKNCNIECEYITTVERTIGTDSNEVFMGHIYKIYGEIEVKDNDHHYLLSIKTSSKPNWLIVYGDTLSSWAFYDAVKQLKTFSEMVELIEFLKVHKLDSFPVMCCYV